MHKTNFYFVSAHIYVLNKHWNKIEVSLVNPIFLPTYWIQTEIGIVIKPIENMILKFNVKIFRADKWKVLHVMVKNNLYLNHSNCRKLHLCPPPTTPRLSHRGGQQIANRFRLLGKAGQVMCLLNSIILNHYSLLLCLILCNYGISQSCQLLLFTLLPNRKKCRKVYFSRN